MSSHSNRSCVRHMVKRRKSRRYFSRIRRRGGHKDRRLPILPTIGLATSQLSGLGSNRMGQDGPIGEFMKTKNVNYLLHDELLTFTGYDIVDGSWSPFEAKGLLVVIGTTLASKLAGRFVNPTIKKIPILGRYIKL